MFNKQVVSAVAALGMASGAAALSCSDATATITSAADATTIASCTTVKGSVLIAPESDATLDLSGDLTSIEGDLIGLNNGAITSLSSTSLQSIGGAFQLHNDTLLSTLKFDVLTSVGSIDWQSLTHLPSLTFTTGVTSADSVTISDTFLSTLDGINIQSVQSMDINNNKRLTEFTTQLSNLTTLLNINANGMNLTINMPNLEWIANATISNVTSFSAQSLAAVNGSFRLDSNYMTVFSAPNLTTVGSDLSFVSNPYVTNITIPLLKSVGGGFTIANNTAIETLNGFPALESVGGAVLLRGDFTEVDLPSLDQVDGGFDLSSTGDIDTSCDFFNKLAPKSGNGDIQGSYSCTSNNSNANNDTSTTGGSTGGTSDTKSGASLMSMSTSTVVTLAGLGALISAFL